MAEDLGTEPGKDLKAELKEMAGLVRWELLKPHAVRDAVVVVNPQLELTGVGEAIASDNTQAVSRWINEQLIVKPTAKQLAQWSQENKLFMSLIVQPYVLVQDVLSPDDLSPDDLSPDDLSPDTLLQDGSSD